MILAVGFALALADTLSGIPPWAEFSRSGARSSVVETVTVDYARQVTPDRMEYQLTYTLVTREGSKSVSTTSVACPRARAVIGSMRDLAMPSFAPYGFNGDNRSSVRDGTFYSLRAPTNLLSGTATISSNENTPLSRWVDKALADLSPCWTKPA